GARGVRRPARPLARFLLLPPLPLQRPGIGSLGPPRGGTPRLRRGGGAVPGAVPLTRGIGRRATAGHRGSVAAVVWPIRAPLRTRPVASTWGHSWGEEGRRVG